MYLKKLLTCSILMLSFGSYAQTLKLTFVKGQKYEVTTKSTLSSVATIMGQEMETNTDNTTVQVIEVKDTRANETDLASTTTKLVATAQMMGQDMSYNSDKKDNTGQLAESLDKIVGKIKNSTIDALGKVVKEDKDETVDDMGAMFAGMSGSVISLLKQALLGKELRAGTSWPENALDTAGKMKLTTVGTYTVSALNNDTHTATIVFTGTQTGSGIIEQMGQEMNITSLNKVDSQFEVDINSGVIAQSSNTINGTSNIDAAGMIIPVITKSTTNTTIKKL